MDESRKSQVEKIPGNTDENIFDATRDQPLSTPNT